VRRLEKKGLVVVRKVGNQNVVELRSVVEREMG
jgi:uncharacterized membrane protein